MRRCSLPAPSAGCSIALPPSGCEPRSSAAPPTTSSPRPTSPRDWQPAASSTRPDFIANAGGLISVYGELRRLPAERALGLAAGIEGTLAEILTIADGREITPLDAARELADARLERGAGLAPVAA